jgi:magnesium and cobalt transporter
MLKKMLKKILAFPRFAKALFEKKEPRDNLISYLHEAESLNVVDADTVRMMEGALLVSEMQVRDIMVPRSEAVFVEEGGSPQDFLSKAVDSGHSRFPVFDDRREAVIGILLAKDLLNNTISEDKVNLKDLLRPPVFVPESKRLNILLREFKANRQHLAVVVDEYGTVSGLVSIEDVIEQIVGEIDDEHDYNNEENIRRHGKERYTVKATTPLDELSEYFNVSFQSDDCETIGGLIAQNMGHVPKKGEESSLSGFLFKVLRADRRRVRLLRVTVDVKE